MPDPNSIFGSPSLSTDHIGESADAFVMMDLNGRVADWSPQAEKLFGWSREAAHGQLLGSLIVPEQYRDAHWAGLERYRKTGQGRLLNQRLKLTAVNQSGEEFPVEFSIAPTRIGDQVLFCSVIRSLSQRDLQRDTESQHAVDSRLFQQAASRWWTAESFEAALQDCVDILCSLSGWPIGHALVLDTRSERLKSADVWHLDDKDRFQSIVEATRHQRFAKGEGVPGRIWAAGETVWSADIGDDQRFSSQEFADFELRGIFGFPVIAEGELVAVLEFFTEEALAPDPQLLMQVSSLGAQLARAIEKRRWESDRLRLAAIVDSSYDAIISKDAAGKIVSWNAGAEQVYGYTAEEAVGESIALILPDELAAIGQDEPEIRAAVKSGRRLVQFETERKHKSGRLISVAITVTPLRDSKGRIVGSSTIERDMSSRRQREQELQVAKEQAELGNRMKSEFLANISHELRTPMNAIIGMLELSLAEDLTPILQDYLTTARDSADTLLYLLNDLLDFSRIEAGRFELDEEPFSLHEVVDGAMKTLSLRAHEKGLELTAHITKDVPDQLLGDGHRLRQVIINLVSNAIKFTEQGEVAASVSMKGRTADDVELSFSVRDTGVGIAAHDQETIFRPFMQLDASTTRQQPGTGLGLAICQELIQKMGGELALESEVGNGSTFSFTVRFPLARVAATPIHVPDLCGVSVLVVDDNETNRKIICEMLSGWNMTPTMLSDAREALDRIRHASEEGHGFELVIVDALMPVIDGFSLIETIHEEGLTDLATVLMLSSADRQIFKDRCDELEIAAYLEKPISQSDMFDAVVTALRQPSEDEVFVATPSTAGGSLSILLAEDTPANQKVIRAVLEKRGHIVEIAHNGREAIEMHRQNEYDVILMDVQMPTMDGLQATETIRDLSDTAKSQVSIIAMTAHARREDRRRCLQAGMNAYIAKPIDFSRLLELVERPRRRPMKRTRVATANGGAAETPSMLMRPETPTMNRRAALERMGGNEELFRNLIRFFLDDAPELLLAADDAIRLQESEALQRAAHSLSGLASNFDAAPTVNSARSLETMGRTGNLTGAAEALVQLQEAVRTLSAELKKHL